MMKWNLINKDRADDIEEIFDILLENRGYDDDDSKEFVDPSLDNLYDSLKLFDSKSASERIEKAIKSKEKIFIHGDYDADGITATSLLWNYLYRERGADVTPYIPSRKDEGYGLSVESVGKLKEQGAQLIITVDSGIRDVELVDNEKDVDFIITDHHPPGEEITKNGIIVHPMYPKIEYPYQTISGCAVAWKLVCAMEKLRLGKKFDIKKVPGLDLVGLSTVTDLMPLKDENRIFVKLGLEKLKKGENLGISKLIQVSKIEPDSLDTYHFGFIIGPKLNASGRIGDPMDGVRLLLTEDEKIAWSIAKKLSKLNEERQEMTESIMKDIESQISLDDNLIFAHGVNWEEGIIGLAAGKIQEKYYKPVIVTTGSNKEVKGSARSIKSFNITEAIEEFKDSLEKYGGHAQAAGFTLKKENLEKFRKEIVAHANKNIKKKDLEREIGVDMILDAKFINYDLVETVNKLKPFGMGSKKPIFEVDSVVVVNSRVIGNGDKHLKFTIKSEDSELINCIFFNGGEMKDVVTPGSIIDLVGSPEVNVWNGQESIQMGVKDVRISK